MSEEKIYYQDQQVTVTSSKVQLGSKIYVLRNLAAVQAVCLWPRLINIIAGIGCFIAIPTGGPFSTSEMIMLGIVGILLLMIPSFWGLRIDSGGTRSTRLVRTNSLLVDRVANAINASLLDLDKKEQQSSSKVVVDSDDVETQLKRMKKMLEDDLITEADYEQKKKQLLGL